MMGDAQSQSDGADTKDETVDDASADVSLDAKFAPAPGGHSSPVVRGGMKRNTSFDGANISPEAGKRPSAKFDLGGNLNPPSREPSLHKGNAFAPGTFSASDEGATGGMRRNDSFSWMWKWDLSPSSSVRASNAPSREGSQHSGNAFEGMKRSMSITSLWNWKQTPTASPAPSREGSAHGGNAFGSKPQGKGLLENMSFMWNWARFRGEEDPNAQVLSVDANYPQADLGETDPVPEGMPKDHMWSWGVGRPSIGPSPASSREASQHAGALWSNGTLSNSACK